MTKKIRNLRVGCSVTFPVKKATSVVTITSRVKKQTGMEFTTKIVETNIIVFRIK